MKIIINKIMTQKKPAHGQYDELKERGLRITKPRKAILDILHETLEHPSAEEIYMQVHRSYPNIGLTTVYRTLDLLADMGIIATLHVGDGRNRYELVQSSQKPGHHHHLVCTGCKKIIDYDDFVDEEVQLLNKVERSLTDKHNFDITGHTIQFYGICDDCRSTG